MQRACVTKSTARTHDWKGKKKDTYRERQKYVGWIRMVDVVGSSGAEKMIGGRGRFFAFGPSPPEITSPASANHTPCRALAVMSVTIAAASRRHHALLSRHGVDIPGPSQLYCAWRCAQMEPESHLICSDHCGWLSSINMHICANTVTHFYGEHTATPVNLGITSGGNSCE